MWIAVLVATTTTTPTQFPLVCTNDILNENYCDTFDIDCAQQFYAAKCPQKCGHACTFCNDEVLQYESEYCENNFNLQSYDNLSHFEDLCRSAFFDIGDYFGSEHVPYCTCMCKQFWANATTTTTTTTSTTSTTSTTIVLPQYCTDPAHPAYNEILNGFDDSPECSAVATVISVAELCADSIVFAMCPSLCGHACTFCNADVLATEDNLYNCTEIQAAAEPAAACANKSIVNNNNRYSVCSCTCRDAFNFTVTTTTPTTTTPSPKSTSTAVPIALGVTAAVLVTAAAGGWWYSHRRKTGYESTTNWL